MKTLGFARCAGTGYGPRDSCVEQLPCAPWECRRKMSESDVVRNPHPGREAYRARLKEISRRLGPLAALSGSHGTWSAAQSAELARRLVEAALVQKKKFKDVQELLAAIYQQSQR